MIRTTLLTLTTALLLSACTEAPSRVQTETDSGEPANIQQRPEPKVMVASAVSGPQAPYAPEVAPGLKTAVFAGGCFWCVEKDFESVPGVIEVTSGYTGGRLDNPDYKTVTYKETGHFEAAEVLYDPQEVSYRELVDYFWTTIDPTDDRGQFCDKGSSYRSAVFATPEQMKEARESLKRVRMSKPFEAEIVTPVLPAVTFYDAEDYHQDFYKKSPVRYKTYRTGCRRDAKLKKLWGENAQAIPK